MGPVLDTRSHLPLMCPSPPSTHTQQLQQLLRLRPPPFATTFRTAAGALHVAGAGPREVSAREDVTVEVLHQVLGISPCVWSVVFCVCSCV